MHLARNAPRPSSPSLVASRQAPNLPRTTTNENPRTLPFQTRFRAPSGLFQHRGGERLELPDLIDYDWRSSDAAGRYAVSPGSNLVPTSANVCCHNDCRSNRRGHLAVTGLVYCLTPEVAAPLRQRPAGLISLQSWARLLDPLSRSIPSRPRPTCRIGSWCGTAGYSGQDPGDDTNGPSGGASFGFESITTSTQP